MECDKTYQWTVVIYRQGNKQYLETPRQGLLMEC